jgi:ferredoxin/DNA-binding Lrp family transcriptional regulator
MAVANEFKAYAKKLGFPESETMGRILELLFPDESGRKIVQALNKPAKLDELAEMTNIPVDELKERTRHLHKIGAIARFLDEEKFRLYPGMIELRDATVVYQEVSLELLELWEHLMIEEFRDVTPVWKASGAPELMRIVPVDESVQSQNLILDVDSVRQIFKDAKVIAAMPCPCRLQARLTGRTHDCPAPQDLNLCMQTNNFARDMIARGVGEHISNEEALHRIDLAEQAGLVHQVRNNIKEDMIICNCCSCCCTGLYMSQKLDYTPYTKSRFRVQFDESLCNGCGLCVKRCNFFAIDIDKNLKPKERTAQINYDKCYGCGLCTLKCPTQALTMIEVRPRESVRNT